MSSKAPVHLHDDLPELALLSEVNVTPRNTLRYWTTAVTRSSVTSVSVTVASDGSRQHSGKGRDPLVRDLGVGHGYVGQHLTNWAKAVTLFSVTSALVQGGVGQQLTMLGSGRGALIRTSLSVKVTSAGTWRYWARAVALTSVTTVSVNVTPDCSDQRWATPRRSRPQSPCRSRGRRTATDNTGQRP